MYFQILKLILWPRAAEAPPRVVEFSKGAVNVISGASKTGKSAVIPIIDYCLGADKCAIPVGVIRENCSWFGVLVETIEGQKLLARREPGDQQRTGDMFFLEGPTVLVPDQTPAKNINVDAVKETLNRLAGLTGLDFEPSDPGFNARPSFRDLMAFNFQPQNIVANPNVLFFKADTTEHREKLKVIFPYVLGAVTARVLLARAELERLLRVLRRKESELRTVESASDAWRLEAQTWLRQAIDLGLMTADTLVPTDWNETLSLLRAVVQGNGNRALLSIAGVDATLGRLQYLRDQEATAAADLSEHRQRLAELRRLLESSTAYGDAIRVQRDRLSISQWLATLGEEREDALVQLTEGSRRSLSELTGALSGLELRLRSLPSLSDSLDKEILRLRGAAEKAMDALNAIRREILELERNSEVAREASNRADRAERFLGRVEQALKLYDEADSAGQLRSEIEDLRRRTAELQRVVREAEIQRKLRNALTTIEATSAALIPQMDAEWPNAPIRLIVEDLTLKIIRGTREDYLWEIGSGANWLAYHVAITAALQRFFLAEPHHPVPSLLVYDQPSQVYFPKRTRENGDLEEASPRWRDEDVDAVRKVFQVLSKEVALSAGRLQVIVLDHAGDEVWGGLDDVVLTEEWRDGIKLVPVDWVSGNS